MRKNAADHVLLNGKMTDASLHIPMLDNPEANRMADEEAIDRAMARGMSREEAERIYGTPFDIRSIESDPLSDD